MTCILKSCAHGKTTCCASLAKAGLGECGAAYALDLASRNDGYLVITHNNPTIDALVKAGLVTVKRVVGGCGIVRTVKVSGEKTNRNARGRRSTPRIIESEAVA